MNRSAAKFKFVAAVTVVAVALACLFAALFFTRAEKVIEDSTVAVENNTANSVNEQYSYGDRRPGDNVPSEENRFNIYDADDLTAFLSNSYTYGLLQNDISIASSSTDSSNEVKPSTNRVLSAGKTLDGNGHTITTYFAEASALDCREVDGGLPSSWYSQWFTFNRGAGASTDAVEIGNDLYAYGVSNIVSVNHGTIKNLKVQVSRSSNGKDATTAVVTAPEGYNGNIGMGVVAGINFGTIQNCATTINIPYGFYGSPVQAYSSNAGSPDNKILSTQGIVAVGGIVGINKGNVLNTQVNQNANIGTYRARYTVRYSVGLWRYETTGDIYNDNIGSGIVGGVAGLNDGGIINGVNYNATAGNLLNKNNHTSVSYTGMITGLANLQNAKGGAAVSYDVGYVSQGSTAITNDELSVAAGSIQNIQYNVYNGFAADVEAFAYTADRGGFMVNNLEETAWDARSSYAGVIGGRVTTDKSIYQTLVLPGVVSGEKKNSFRAWGESELNGSLSFADDTMPLLGYGSTTSQNASNYHQNIYVAARLYGQQNEALQTNNYSNDNYFMSAAQVGFVWDSYMEGTNVVNRVLYNVNLDNLPDLAGKTYSVYQQIGSYENSSKNQSVGSDDYNATSMSGGGRVEWDDSETPDWTLMLYKLRINDFSSGEQLTAFLGTDKGANNETFGYAYANAVVLSADTTVSGTLNPSGSRVFPDWKTLDGKGHWLAVSNTSSTVSGSSATATAGGMTFYAYGDLISVNNGTITNIVFRQLNSGERGDISLSGNVAYGNIVGVNNGTMTNVFHNNKGDEALRTVVSTNGAYLALGSVAGINLGKIDNTASITWQDFQGSAQTGTFVGGIVGLNMGSGTLRNAKIDGVSSAIMSASGGEAYLGGILGLGANGTGGGRTVGGLSVTSTLSDSPFSNWFFVGKQTMGKQTMDQTIEAYVGMLAGGVTSAPSDANAPLLGMIVMMPDTQYDVGWFTAKVNTPSLLGRSNGEMSAAGYIATNIVGGYAIVAQDASNLYITSAVAEYNGLVGGDGSFSGTFYSRLDTYSSSYDVPTVAYYHITDAAAAGITVSDNGKETDDPNDANDGRLMHGISATSSVASLAAYDGADNPNYYAQTIALRYNYTVNISQADSEADTSSSQHALYLFLSGDALGAGLEKFPGSYKAIAAGATAATITSDLTVGPNPNGIVFAAPKTSLDGGGHTITIGGDLSGTLSGGANYNFIGADYQVYGELVAINQAEISNLNIVINGTRNLNAGGSVIYGGAFGVNVGGTGEIGNEIRAYVDDVNVTMNGNFSLSAPGSVIWGGVAGVVQYPGNVDHADFVMNGALTIDHSAMTAAHIGEFGYIYGGSVGGVDGMSATWFGDVTIEGASTAAISFGGVAGTFNTGNIVGARATYGADQGWSAYLDGAQYDNSFGVTLGGSDLTAGGVVGSMTGNTGTLKDSSATLNVDFTVTNSGATYADVGGLIGRLTGSGTQVTNSVVSGIGAIAYLGSASNERIGGAVGAIGKTPQLDGVVAGAVGGVYNGGNNVSRGYFSGYNEAGVTVKNSFWYITDDEPYALTKSGGASVFGVGGAPSVSASRGYSIVDASDNFFDYGKLSLSRSGSTLTLSLVNTLPQFVSNATLSPTTVEGGSVTGEEGDVARLEISITGTKIYTDDARDASMLLSALSGSAYAVVGGTHYLRDDDTYEDSRYRYYGWYAGAKELQLIAAESASTDKKVELSYTEIALVFGEGRSLDGNAANGYSITVSGAMQNNVAPQEMVWREGSGDNTEIVNSGLYAAKGYFLARNEGTLSDLVVNIETSTEVDMKAVLDQAESLSPSEYFVAHDGTNAYDQYIGVIFGMLIGVNSGTMTGFPSVNYDGVTSLQVGAGLSGKDAIVGGMVGAQIGAGASISDMGSVTFAENAGVQVESASGASLNRVSAGGIIGMVSNETNDTSVSGLVVTMQAYSFVDVSVSHNFAALGGVVGDLRGIMTGAEFFSEYLSRMLINGTLSGGTAALGGLVGVANGATITTSVVKGVGYMYNGIATDSSSASTSLDLYSGGAIGLAANYATDTSIATATYKRIDPSSLNSVYVDFEGYLRASAGSKVGLVTGRLLDGVTVGEDGSETYNIDTNRIKNIVWKVNYYGDTAWATDAYIDNVSSVFNERTELAVFGYAPALVDGYKAAWAQMGMRIWVTNNRYSGETNNTISAHWDSVGNITLTIDNITNALQYETYTAYFNGATDSSGAALEGEDGITKVKEFHALDDTTGSVAASATIDIADRLDSFGTAASEKGMNTAHGVYVMRFVFNEVLIDDQAELMTFISGGKNTTSKTEEGQTNVSSWMYGLPTSDPRYWDFANADFGVLANNITVDYGATAVTMPKHKSLDGQGFTVTLAASGTVSAYQIWTNRGEEVADEDRGIGILMEGETALSYVSGGETAGTTDGNTHLVISQGTSHFAADNLSRITEEFYHASIASDIGGVGVSVGGLFMGRNLGTISDINFVLPQSVTITNNHYGSFFASGIVTAVNAGTIENCSLTLGENVTFQALRDNCDDGKKTNNTDNADGGTAINTVATAGGYAGIMFKYNASSDDTAYIRNSSLDLKKGSVITVQNEFPTHYWLGMYTRTISFAGGLVGWMLDGSEIYNVILNGEGDVKALATLEGNIWNSSYMVGVSGAITGMNSLMPTFSPITEDGHTQDNFGYVDGVICNWNGNTEYSARYEDGVGGEASDYYYSDRWNYSVGGQMIGLTQVDTIQNVYFMYGVENYSTYHRDNWYYGSTKEARANNADFQGKYEYIVSKSIDLLTENPDWDAIYAPVATGGQDSGVKLTAVAERVNGEVVQGEEFTFTNYNNYNSADPENNTSIFNGVQFERDNDWGFQIYKTTLGANGSPTHYDDITRKHYHKIVEPCADTATNEDNRSRDFVGTRTSARIIDISTPMDMSVQYTPNNIYIYEIPFGESQERELDMNDPNTVVSLTFETEDITSDIRLQFELYTDKGSAEFIWSIEEEWDYPEGSGMADMSETSNYYDTVNSLEAALRNNKFDRTMRRENDSTNLTITYTIGSAVAIAPDKDRYTAVSQEDDEGNITSMTYYDGKPHVYDNGKIDVPTLYYVNYVTQEQMREANINSNLFSYYRINNGDITNLTSTSAPSVVGEYIIRLMFEGEGTDNLKINTTDRTIMFGIDAPYYDFYTAILPYGVTQSQVESITKVYDGTADSTAATVFELSGSIVGSDTLSIRGEFSSKNVGTELDFTADNSSKTYVRIVENGVPARKEIAVFTALDGSATNYALSSSSITQNGDVSVNYNKYTGKGSSTTKFTGKGVITPYIIATNAFDFRVIAPDDADGTAVQAFDTGGTTYVEYANGHVYNTSKFANSTVDIGGNKTFGDKATITDLFGDDDSITFAFAFNDAATATDKGSYTVTLSIDAKDGNYAFAGAATTIEIGTLAISEISLDSLAYFDYEMTDITHTFDGTVPTASEELFGGSLIITDRRGHTLEDGTDYSSVKISCEIMNSAADVGKYELRVTIDEFVSTNYALAAGVSYTFSPTRGSADALLFILPKEIRFDSVVKEYDDTASDDGAVYDYTDGYAPIADDADIVFEGEYVQYDTIGEDKEFAFATSPLPFEINGTTKRFNILSVQGESGNQNYYIASGTIECGGITPIEVELQSAVMIYSGRAYIDYTAEDTEVVIVRAGTEEVIGIQPKANFDTARVGENKAVTFETGTVNIYGKSFRVLKNSEHSDINASSGVTYSGNYYVAEETFSGVGSIVQYTIEWDHIEGVFRVVQLDGASVEDFITFNSGGKPSDTFTYVRDTTIEGRITGNGTSWPNNDALADVIEFDFSEQPDTNGYAGDYTITLTIVAADGSSTPDYVWGAFAGGEKSTISFSFEVAKQTISATATASADPSSWTYNGATHNLKISASVSDNDNNVLTLDTSIEELHNDDFNTSHQASEVLPIGDYTATIGVSLQGDDALNYTYNGGDATAAFSVLPMQLDINSVTKEFDNTTSTTTENNKADFNVSGSPKIDFDAEYTSKGPGNNVGVRFAAQTVNIGGSNHYVFVDARGDVTNYSAPDSANEDGDSVILNVGVITKYQITSSEIKSAIRGYISGAADKQLRDADGAAVFEYRASGLYSAADVVISLTGMRYDLSATAGNSPTVDGVGTLNFGITLDGDDVDATGEEVVLPVGKYSIRVSLSDTYFELADGVSVIGSFEIEKQSVGGGTEGEGGAGFVGGNVIITADRYSYAYGETNFNAPTIDDAEVVLTVTVKDKYSAQEITFEKDVVGTLLYGEGQTATLEGEVLVGEYVVWATGFADALGNYIVDAGAILPVFVTGTTIPDSTETDEEGNLIGVAHDPVYAITPAIVTISSVSKIYDGTTAADGAKIVTAPTEAASEYVGGAFVSPEATHGTDGTETGVGSRDFNVAVTVVTVQDVVYNTLAASGLGANYAVQGTAADGYVLVAGVASIYKLVIDSADMISIASDNFAKTYDGAADIVGVPQMTLTVTIPDGEPLVVTLAPSADSLVFSLDGAAVDAALHVGAYGVSIAPSGLGNFEIADGIAEVAVNGGDPVYFIRPVTITVDAAAKTYDGTTAITETSVLTATGVLEGESVAFGVTFADAAVGIGKTINVAVQQFTCEDGSVMWRILDGSGVGTDYAIDGESDGSVVALTSDSYVISPAPLTLQGSADKTYDGTTDITSSPSAVFSGFVNGETIAPVWNYDLKDSGTRNVLIRVDGTVSYVVGENTYYAVYVGGEEGLITGNYGVLVADNIQEVEVEIPSEDGGEPTTETYYYALFTGAGVISPYQIGSPTAVRVDGTSLPGNKTFSRTETYAQSDVQADLAIGGSSLTAKYDSTVSKLSVTTPYGDKLTFTATFNDTAHDAGTYTLKITLDSNINYTMSSYSGTLTIDPKELDHLYLVVPEYSKVYDGTAELPALNAEGWQAIGLDGSIAIYFDSSVKYGELQAIILNAEGAPLADGDLPVNVLLSEDGVTVGGYRFRIAGVTFENNNYIWDGEYVSGIYTSFDGANSAFGAQTLYTIKPYEVTIAEDSFGDKTFDGAFSLSVPGVAGEYLTIGDKTIDASLAGVYTDLTIVPTVIGVTFDATAANPTTIAANYTVSTTEITLPSLRIGTGNVLTAERALGGYKIGFGAMQGFDFLFAGGQIDEATRAEITTKLQESAASGEPWHEDAFVDGGAMAALNDALIELFTIRLNNSESPIVLDASASYPFNDFAWTAQTDALGRASYSLTFTFAGAAGYDADSVATDRYSFVLKGKTAEDGAAYVASTNTSMTSSELANGQLSAATHQSGAAISDASELAEFLQSGGEGYLTDDIYGFDSAGIDSAFSGTLYGNGHTIQLVGNEPSAVSTGGYAAHGLLVGVNNGTIRDLTIKVMATSVVLTETDSVLGVVGYNAGQLINVGVEIVGALTVDGAEYVGGLVGVNAASGTIEQCSTTLSADVALIAGEDAATHGIFGGVVGYASGSLDYVAIYTTEDRSLAQSGSTTERGLATITVTAESAGGIVGYGNSVGMDGVIAATSRLVGAMGVLGGGTATVSGVHAYSANGLGIADGILDSSELSILAPYPDGLIGYYFTSSDDYTGVGKHNEISSAEERNMTLYKIYGGESGVLLAIEAIAPAGRFVWEGYGLSYRSPLADGNVGMGANRVVAIFATGASVAGSYDAAATITSGVDAFTVAFGIVGSTVVAETTSAIKEVVYTGTPQDYTVTLTVTSPDGTSTEQELTVSGTDVGYYSKSSVEGVISGDSDSYGGVTFDIDNRTAVTVVSGGGSVADGIALIIYPKTASGFEAIKYYDTTSDASVTLTDTTGNETVGGGTYLDANYASAEDADAAVFAAFINASVATRQVIADEDGNFFALISNIEGSGEDAQLVYKLVPVMIGDDGSQVPFGLTTELGGYTAAQIMRAYVQLTDWSEIGAAQAAGLDVGGYKPAQVLRVTGETGSGSDIFSTTSGALYFVIGGGNLILSDTAWTFGGTTIAAQGYDWTAAAQYVIDGENVKILPIDLDISAGLKGTDQSYNHALVVPTQGGSITVGMTLQQAQEAYGLTEEQYNALVAEAQSIAVTVGTDLFESLIESDDIVMTDGQYFAAQKTYQTFTAGAEGVDKSGNFVVNAGGELTLRYFEPSIADDGTTTYLLGSVDDWAALASNEGGVADYNTLDYRLSADINFGGEGAMLAWRDADGNALDFTGTLDGAGFTLAEIFEFNVGDGAKSALIESNVGTIVNVKIVDSVFDAYGDNAAAAGVAIDNHGTIQDCTVEGTIASGTSDATSAKFGGVAVNNYGTIDGCVSVINGQVWASESGSVEAVGIAIGADGAASATDNATLAEIHAYGAATAQIGGAVIGSGSASNNGFVQDVAFKDGAKVAEADEASAKIVWSDNAEITAVVNDYVFNTALVAINGDGDLVTDNFRKLIAVLRMFAFAGAGDMTNTSASAWGKYAEWLAAHTIG